MPDDLPAPVGGNLPPSMSDWIASWLGFQLPSIPMPQTVKNLDKAVGKILLAAGENAEARIKSNTGKARAKGRIDVDGMYRTEEDKRKVENRAASVKVAVDELNDKPGQHDAHAEIDDDWLNLYARMAEDKTSEELRSLFGKILAGEIRKPGTFSLRTMQFISTLSRDDAHKISQFFSLVLEGQFVPLFQEINTEVEPGLNTRRLMEELSLASPPNTVSGLEISSDMTPQSKSMLRGIGHAVLVQNRTDVPVRFVVQCQVLTKTGQELVSIANPPPTPVEFLRRAAQAIFNNIQPKHSKELLAGQIVVTVNVLAPASNGVLGPVVYTASAPGQPPAA
jgi:hypothetical protein